ncbi:MAG: efflux transporter outer membrane subunit [Sedimentisphaerales bacterium]|nr:efflux transporter outer membrane subunit [Sedimentisphaerales bacterium]
MKRKLFYICWFYLFLGCLVFNGCMVGPDYSRPETAAETSDGFYYAGEHDEDVNDFTPIDRWWESFGDPVTAQMVREALENNYDLKAAAARVMQSQAVLAETRGLQWPDVSYNLNRDRSKRSFNFGGFAGGGRFTVMSTTWSHDITASYILDFFGKLRRSEQAAWADLLAAETNEQVLINSIIASVVNARINIAILQRRLAIARANTESRQKTLETVERRYAKGLVGPVDIRLARENLAASKALEPSIELSLITARHALDVLLAHRPGSSDDLPETLSDLPELGKVPIGLPASLLDRRPDVKAAEFTLRAANERIGVSIAQLFPDLALTGSFGYSGDTMEEIFQYDYTEMYAAIFNLTQPIFKGGQIQAQINAAKARYQEQAANYAGIVLNALREVEDALITEQMLQTQLEQSQIRLTEAKAAESLSKQRYQSGVEGILAVLESERRSRAAEEELIVLKGQIWTSRVNLYLALGGDWDEQENEIMVVGKDDKK